MKKIAIKMRKKKEKRNSFQSIQNQNPPCPPSSTKYLKSTQPLGEKFLPPKKEANSIKYALFHFSVKQPWSLDELAKLDQKLQYSRDKDGIFYFYWVYNPGGINQKTGSKPRKLTSALWSSKLNCAMWLVVGKRLHRYREEFNTLGHFLQRNPQDEFRVFLNIRTLKGAMMKFKSIITLSGVYAPVFQWGDVSFCSTTFRIDQLEGLYNSIYPSQLLNQEYVDHMYFLGEPARKKPIEKPIEKKPQKNQ